MKSSKLIPDAGFEKLPQSQAANVKENIDNWLERDYQYGIKNLLVPCEKGYRGYRFVSSGDLSIKKTVQVKILKVPLDITYHRAVVSYSSLDPLWYIQKGVGVTIIYGTFQLKFNSDTQLKRVLKALQTIPCESEDYFITDYLEGKYVTAPNYQDGRTEYSYYFGR